MTSPLTPMGQAPAVSPLAARFAAQSAQPARTAAIPDSMSIRFGGQVHKNHGIHLPMDVEYDLNVAGQVQRQIMVKSLEKLVAGDKSNLQLFLDSYGGKSASLPWATGMSDSMLFSDVPVDVIIRTYANIEALMPFLAATGKRMMYEKARIKLGPTTGWYNGPATDSNSRVRFYNEATRQLEWRIMDVAGIKPTPQNRQKVASDINNGLVLNTVQALAYGSKGLTDGVLVAKEKPGETDMVLTRAGLNKFFKTNGLSGASRDNARTQFLNHPKNVAAVVQWCRENGALVPFEKFAAASISQIPVSHWKSPFEESDKKDDAKKDGDKPGNKVTALLADLTRAVEELSLTGDAKAGEKADEEKEEKKKLSVKGTKADGKTSDLTLSPHVDIKAEEDLAQLAISHPGNEGRADGPGILEQDVLFFHNPFDEETPKGFERALLTLNDKKVAEREEGRDPGHIMIMENSPGGSSIVTEQISSVIGTLDLPVDVIVAGWGASGGSKLVSMATGNRFMTPSSMILLHETRGGSPVGPMNLVQGSADDMNYSKESYMKLVSDRTGRDIEEVRQDFKLDFWLNPVESLLYGSRGLTDAVLVNGRQVVTRDNLLAYLKSEYGWSKKQAEDIAQAAFVDRRNGEHSGSIDRHDENDPLANPLSTIADAAAKGYVTTLADSKQFAESMAGTAKNEKDVLAYCTVLQKEGW